jgi:hypothetical protein
VAKVAATTAYIGATDKAINGISKTTFIIKLTKIDGKTEKVVDSITSKLKRLK